MSDRSHGVRILRGDHYRGARPRSDGRWEMVGRSRFARIGMKRLTVQGDVYLGGRTEHHLRDPERYFRSAGHLAELWECRTRWVAHRGWVGLEFTEPARLS